MKKLLTFVFVAVFTISLFCSFPVAAVTSEGWTIKHTSVTIISQEGLQNWLKRLDQYSETVTSIVLEGDVTTIPEYAFSTCIALVSVKATDSRLEAIGEGAFSGCARLKKVSLPSTVRNIGNDAFSGCIFFQTVEFSGGPSQWEDVYVGSGNEMLVSANAVITGKDPFLGENGGFYIICTVGGLLVAAAVVFVVLEIIANRKREKFYYRVWQVK